jgi:hypothetical protein
MEIEGEMSRKEFSVAYDGPNRGADHSIDVDVLAPALLAFGKLIREANKEANSKMATAKVLVVSDFEHKCFNVNFEVVLTLLEQAKTLIGTQKAKDAKEILEWLGLLHVTGSGATLGFLKFLEWRAGRKIVSKTELKDSDQAGVVSVKVEGDNNQVSIHNHTWNLSNNPRALAAARDALSPIGIDGFDSIQLRDGGRVIGEIPKHEADDILASCMTGISDSKDITPDIDVTSAWLTVYAPVYDAGADRWRFKLGKDIVYVDISETTISQDALEQRGGALADDTYQVKLEIETGKTPDGNDKKPTYKVLEVLRFIPANPELQTDLPLPKEETPNGDT